MLISACEVFLMKKKNGFTVILTALLLMLISFQIVLADQLTPIKKNELPHMLITSNPLIVVHATTEFDEDRVAVKGINKVIAKYKGNKKSIIYLVSDQSKEGYSNWYTKNRSPDYELFSEGGEHNLPLRNDEVTIVGGFFGSYDGARGCHTLAIRDAIRMHFELSDNPFTVHIPLEAIYFWSEDTQTRKKIIDLNIKSPSSEIAEIFDRFAESYFLVDTWSDVTEFSHPYVGNLNKKYKTGGPVNVDRFTFRLYLNDVLVVEPFGHGPRQVLLKLESVTL